jgi:hypothetical protein
VKIERLPGPARRPSLAASPTFPHAAVVWERPGRFGPKTIGHRDVMLRVGGTVIRVRGHKRYLARGANVPPAIGADAVVAAAAPLRRGFVIVRVDARGEVMRRRVPAPHFLNTRDMAVAGSRAVFGYTSLDASASGPARPEVIDSGVHELDPAGDFVSLGAGGGRVVAVWRRPGETDPGSIVRAAVAEPGQPFGPAQTISAPGEWQDPNGYPLSPVALNGAGAGIAAYVGRDPQYGQVPARVTVVRLAPS